MNRISEILTSTLKDSGIEPGDVTENLSNKQLTYDVCTRMILDVGAQIERLKEEGYGLLYVGPEHVFQTTSGAFILDSQRDLYYKCRASGYLDITRPFKKTESMAPEVLAIDSLPADASYTSAYYSLGSLACKTLGVADDITLLKPTKLYFLLERCMSKDPSGRIFLFI